MYFYLIFHILSLNKFLSYVLVRLFQLILKVTILTRAAIEGGDLGLCHLSISEISKMCHLSILAFRAKKGPKTVKNGVLRRFWAILRPKFSCGAFGAAKSRFFQFFGPKNVSFIEFFGAFGAEKCVTYRFLVTPSLAGPPPYCTPDRILLLISNRLC